MKLALYDKGGGEFYGAARPAATAVLGASDSVTFDPAMQRDVNCLREFSHIVCHLRSDQTEPSWPRLLAGDLSRVKVIIRVSSQGAGGMQSFAPPHRLNETGPWILHLRERSAEVAENRWQRIFNALKSWDTTEPVPTKQLVAIFEPNLETFLTLQLLSEAWLLKNWSDRALYPELQTLSATLKIEGVEPQFPEGIDLKPPLNRDDWLKPFREGGDTTDPLPALLNEMPTEATKRVVEDFFSKLTGGHVEFKDVANLFLEMNKVVKKST